MHTHNIHSKSEKNKNDFRPVSWAVLEVLVNNANTPEVVNTWIFCGGHYFGDSK